jgi:ketopantoate hydroxymethyltransferase
MSLHLWPSGEEVARAKAIWEQETAVAQAEMRSAARDEELDRGAATLLIVEMIDRFGADRIHRWVQFTALAMGASDPCRRQDLP